MYCEWESATHGPSIKYRHTQHPLKWPLSLLFTRPSRRGAWKQLEWRIRDFLRGHYRNTVRIDVSVKVEGSWGRPKSICYTQHEFNEERRSRRVARPHRRWRRRGRYIPSVTPLSMSCVPEGPGNCPPIEARIWMAGGANSQSTSSIDRDGRIYRSSAEKGELAEKYWRRQQRSTLGIGVAGKWMVESPDVGLFCVSLRGDNMHTQMVSFDSIQSTWNEFRLSLGKLSCWSSRGWRKAEMSLFRFVM